MKAVLFATRAVPELAPLTEGSCDALLPVACKPLIIHNIEALVMAGITDVVVIVSPNAHAVEAALGDGTRWGMRFEYVLATASESQEHTLDRIRHRLGGEYLTIRGEMLRTPIVPEFLKQAQALSAASVSATIGGAEAGLKLIRNGLDTIGGMNADSTVAEHAGATAYIEFPAACLAVIDSPKEFHRANLAILDGAFDGIIVPGREIAPQVRAGRHSYLPADTVKASRLLIGTRCRIAKGAEACGRVVISDDVVVGSRATMRDAVIMPNTYVGELVEVADAIVAGNRLIHVDTGVVTTVPDNFLLASIRNIGLRERIGAAFGRLGGALLLAASLPLWPIALMAAILRNPRQPLRSRVLTGNRKGGPRNGEFKALEFTTGIPILRCLPYLLAVVKGDLRLIGVEPLEAASAARCEEWELVRDEGQVGLLGPVQLTAGLDMPSEERRIIEAGYVATASIAGDLQWMLRALAALTSRRAWLPAKPVARPRAERQPLADQSRQPVRLADYSARSLNHAATADLGRTLQQAASRTSSGT